MRELTPKQIVYELDKYIVGQQQAKRSVAIAVRNRWRRQQLPADLRDEVVPKNIIMIGPTGVGKTEIARRLANLVDAPFLKVEASKYTEVGYHGRDVESMVRDLVEIAVNMVRQKQVVEVQEKAAAAAEERLLDLLLPSPPGGSWNLDESADKELQERRRRSREKMRQKLRKGELEDSVIELAVEDRNTPMVEVFSSAGMEMGMDIQNMFEKIIPGRTQVRKVTVADGRKILIQQESEKLIDKEKVTREAVERAENMGIVFIDEIDKVAGEEKSRGPDVSRAGVQRDLLPIVEGSTVTTRHGVVRTDHILFIAAGAFNVSKPSDLIPELQGRFPIRVELQSLKRSDFVKILTEPRNALTTQYAALLKTEGLSLEFSKKGIEELASICEQVNQRMQNIGARRLHTLLEKLLEEISFDAPEMKQKKVRITDKTVRERLADIVEDEDLSRYIL